MQGDHDRIGRQPVVGDRAPSRRRAVLEAGGPGEEAQENRGEKQAAHAEREARLCDLGRQAERERRRDGRPEPHAGLGVGQARPRRKARVARAEQGARVAGDLHAREGSDASRQVRRGCDREAQRRQPAEPRLADQRDDGGAARRSEPFLPMSPAERSDPRANRVRIARAGAEHDVAVQERDPEMARQGTIEKGFRHRAARQECYIDADALSLRLIHGAEQDRMVDPEGREEADLERERRPEARPAGPKRGRWRKCRSSSSRRRPKGLRPAGWYDVHGRRPRWKTRAI